MCRTLRGTRCCGRTQRHSADKMHWILRWRDQLEKMPAPLRVARKLRVMPINIPGSHCCLFVCCKFKQRYFKMHIERQRTTLVMLKEKKGAKGHHGTGSEDFLQSCGSQHHSHRHTDPFGRIESPVTDLCDYFQMMLTCSQCDRGIKEVQWRRASLAASVAGTVGHPWANKNTTQPKSSLHRQMNSKFITELK